MDDLDFVTAVFCHDLDEPAIIALYSHGSESPLYVGPFPDQPSALLGGEAMLARDDGWERYEVHMLTEPD